MNKMQKPGFVKAFLLVTFQDLSRVTLSFLVTKKILRTKVMNPYYSTIISQGAPFMKFL